MNSPARHASGRDLIGVLLDADFLPIAEPALADTKLPLPSVLASWVVAHSWLGVLELLLDVPGNALAFSARKRAEEKFWTNFRRARDGAADGDELTDLLGAQLADAGCEAEVVEGDVEVAQDQT